MTLTYAGQTIECFSYDRPVVRRCLSTIERSGLETAFVRCRTTDGRLIFPVALMRRWTEIVAPHADSTVSVPTVAVPAAAASERRAPDTDAPRDTATDAQPQSFMHGKPSRVGSKREDALADEVPDENSSWIRPQEVFERYPVLPAYYANPHSALADAGRRSLVNIRPYGKEWIYADDDQMAAWVEVVRARHSASCERDTRGWLRASEVAARYPVLGAYYASVAVNLSSKARSGKITRRRHRRQYQYADDELMRAWVAEIRAKVRGDQVRAQYAGDGVPSDADQGAEVEG